MPYITYLHSIDIHNLNLFIFVIVSLNLNQDNNLYCNLKPI